MSRQVSSKRSRISAAGSAGRLPRPPRSTSRRTASSSRRRRWLYGIGGFAVLAGLGWLLLQGFASPSPPAVAERSGQGPAQAAMVGMPAPSIPLPATTGGQLTLDQYRGQKVVLYFYEGAG